MIQFPGHAPPPTSFGAPPGTPSAPGAYSQSGGIGFTSGAPVSFGMPQPYSPYPSTPYPPQSGHSTNQYPPPASGAAFQQMPLPMPQSTPSYPFQQMQQPCNNPGQPSAYPQQRDYNLYPNIHAAPDAKECFDTPSPYNSASDAYSNNSSSYQSRSYPGGQGAGYYPPRETNSFPYQPKSAPAPRKSQFMTKVRVRCLKGNVVQSVRHALILLFLSSENILHDILVGLCCSCHPRLCHTMILMPEQMQKF